MPNPAGLEMNLKALMHAFYCLKGEDFKGGKLLDWGSKPGGRYVDLLADPEPFTAANGSAEGWSI